MTDFRMDCDRPCMTERGLLIQPGTSVTWLARIAQRAVRVQMPDGSEESVNPACFRQSRMLDEFRARAIRAIGDANLHHGADEEVSGLRAALESLPDRALLDRLPPDIRVYIEVQFAMIKGGGG